MRHVMLMLAPCASGAVTPGDFSCFSVFVRICNAERVRCAKIAPYSTRTAWHSKSLRGRTPIEKSFHI